MSAYKNLLLISGSQVRVLVRPPVFSITCRDIPIDWAVLGKCYCYCMNKSLYAQLDDLIETMPDLAAFALPPEALAWVGQAQGLVYAIMGNSRKVVDLEKASGRLGSIAYRWEAAQQIVAIVHRVRTRARSVVLHNVACPDAHAGAPRWNACRSGRLVLGRAFRPTPRRRRLPKKRVSGGSKMKRCAAIRSSV